jgi:hypothetical protein
LKAEQLQSMIDGKIIGNGPTAREQTDEIHQMMDEDMLQVLAQLKAKREARAAAKQ